MNMNVTRQATVLAGMALLATAFPASLLQAQEIARPLSGQVLDEQGQPVPGATLLLRKKDTKQTYQASTDAAGSFSLAAVAGNYTVTITSVGYGSETRELAHPAGKALSYVLKTDYSTLNNVVVTALGIKREYKALGSATQTLGSKEVNDARANNWSAALSGKVAGLSLISPGSGPVNSTRISLRGDAALDADGNNALIVIDGVPIQSGGNTSGVSSAYGAGSGNDVPVDFGNGLQDINPDDIESISILKGPGATALYGSRAGGGAILITTKSGSKQKGIGITVNSNYSINTVLKWPDYQYEYGQGTGTVNSAGQLYYSYGASPDGPGTSGTSSAFGPKFDGQLYFQYDPNKEGRGDERTLWRPYKDNITGFWRTGSTLTNNISLEGGNERGGMRASITHSKNTWIMPNTGYERLTVQAGGNYKLSDKLSMNTRLSYTNKKSDNLPATGYNNQSIAYFMIFQNPNVDLNWYRPIWKRNQHGLQQIHPFSSFIDNPFLIAHEMTNSINANSVVANLGFRYEFTKKLDLAVRGTMNMNSEFREMRRPFNTANFLSGYYKQQDVGFLETNADFLLSYHDRIADRVDVKVSAGGNTMNAKEHVSNAFVDGLVVPGVYKLTNGQASPTLMVTDNNFKVNSLYGIAAFSYRDRYFIDFTGRQDWWSTLSPKSNSMFYPSVNASVILSDVFALPKPFAFAKLRGSVAGAGFDSRKPYLNKRYYDQSPFSGSATAPNVLFNENLSPRRQVSYETGLDLRLFSGRVHLDVTYYQNFTTNQIMEIPVDPTTGYARKVINGGKVQNKGVEILLATKNIAKPHFSWNTTFTWARNRNKVLSLPAEIESDYFVIATGGNAYQQTRVGGSSGDIYGFGFLRSPDGQIIYGANGLPARPAEVQYIGNAYADWKGGIQNEFRYRNFRFSFLIDGQYGGIVYSQTHHKMSEQGKLEHTLRGRAEGYIIGEGVVETGPGRYAPNTTKVAPATFYAEYYRRANVEANSFDASFVKLREARLEYSLSKKHLGKFFKSASFAVYGRDLLMLSRFPMFDPETAALNGTSIMPGVEMGQLPSTRTIGANLTFKF
ncbi:SusC/RagA family TonB-linked outer membrane protein [Flaviaesturariibacter amylovorans]|uniref:SusC/RagA family TonB-linked outer membrane protein n=1 Tax=Flaviaesturariibacter amylovorans TaxID=1084520 RepID=A0ABP8H7E3_9BACT